ncbi:MAG: hypothetical protein U0Q11_26980 [Vicinamibacterales bacterium]
MPCAIASSVLPRHVEAANVVQSAVVGLAHKGIYRTHFLVPSLRERVAHHGIDGGSDGQRIGQDDRRFDGAKLVDLR